MFIYRKSYTLVLLLTIFFGIISSPGPAAAKPTIQIISVLPDVRNQTIPVGRYTEIKLFAKVSPPDAELAWSHNKIGRFDGNTHGLASIYVLPVTISGGSQQIELTVTATDQTGTTAKATIRFTLEAPIVPLSPTPEPRPTSTHAPSLTPTPTAMPTFTPTVATVVPSTPTPNEVERLLAKAENCFQQRKYTTPKNNNAFGYYKEALEKEPGNFEARQRLHDIIQIYKTWGGTADSRQKPAKAIKHYQCYLDVARYLLQIGDSSIQADYNNIQKRVYALQNPIPTPTPTPAPTFTPVPTSTPTPKLATPTTSPTPTSPPASVIMSSPTPPIHIPAWNPGECPTTHKRIEELVQKSLPEDFTAYKDLKEQEDKGSFVNEAMIEVLERILCDFVAVEQLLQKNYDASPDSEIRARIQKIRQTRQHYEQELSNRRRQYQS